MASRCSSKKVQKDKNQCTEEPNKPKAKLREAESLFQMFIDHFIAVYIIIVSERVNVYLHIAISHVVGYTKINMFISRLLHLYAQIVTCLIGVC